MQKIEYFISGHQLIALHFGVEITTNNVPQAPNAFGLLMTRPEGIDIVFYFGFLLFATMLSDWYFLIFLQEP